LVVNRMKITPRGRVSEAAEAGGEGDLAKTEPPSRLFLSRPL